MNQNANKTIITEVDLGDRLRSVELLYQAGLQNLELSRELWLAEGKRQEATHYALYSNLLLKELQNSVNLKEGGALAATLNKLYDFMQYHLIEAVTGPEDQAKNKIGEVIGLLRQLSNAWSKMMRQQASAAQTASIAPCASAAAPCASASSPLLAKSA